MKEKFTKRCAICDKVFGTKWTNKKFCSPECKWEANRIRSREHSRVKRGYKIKQPKPKLDEYYEMRVRRSKDLTRCAICGYNLTVDWHHYSKGKGSVIALCPNHHALVTRGILVIEVYE